MFVVKSFYLDGRELREEPPPPPELLLPPDGRLGAGEDTLVGALLWAGRALSRDGRLCVGRDCVLGAVVRSVRDGRLCVGRVALPGRTPSERDGLLVPVGRVLGLVADGRTLLPDVRPTALAPRDGRELPGRTLSVLRLDGRGRIVLDTKPG